jgi:Flp pilus assembly protein TadD
MDFLSANTHLDSTPLNIIGIEKADLGEIEIAIRYFTDAITINPDDPKAYFNRATLKVKIGDIQGAHSDFMHAQKLSGLMLNIK